MFNLSYPLFICTLLDLFMLSVHCLQIGMSDGACTSSYQVFKIQQLRLPDRPFLRLPSQAIISCTPRTSRSVLKEPFRDITNTCNLDLDFSISSNSDLDESDVFIDGIVPGKVSTCT